MNAMIGNGRLDYGTEPYPAKYNKNSLACMTNSLILGKQNLSLREIKLVRWITSQVKKSDDEFRVYKCKITSLAQFLSISPDSLYRDIMKICESLMQKVVTIAEKDAGNSKRAKWQMFHWMEVATYNGNGVVEFKLSREIKPFLLELDSFFTSYQIGEIIAMKSQYSIRIYEILKCQDMGRCKDVIEISIEDLRTLLDCEKKYSTNAEFIRRTVSIAKEEINEKSNMAMDYKLVKSSDAGGRIVSIQFFCHWFNTLADKQLYQDNQLRVGNVRATAKLALEVEDM